MLKKTIFFLRGSGKDNMQALLNIALVVMRSGRFLAVVVVVVG
jgi:hypothetical protein